MLETDIAEKLLEVGIIKLAGEYAEKEIGCEGVMDMGFKMIFEAFFGQAESEGCGGCEEGSEKG